MRTRRNLAALLLAAPAATDAAATTKVYTLERPGRWEAWLEMNGGYWAAGATEAAAIGQLVLQYPDLTGLAVERKS